MTDKIDLAKLQALTEDLTNAERLTARLHEFQDELRAYIIAAGQTFAAAVPRPPTGTPPAIRLLHAFGYVAAAHQIVREVTGGSGTFIEGRLRDLVHGDGAAWLTLFRYAGEAP